MANSKQDVARKMAALKTLGIDPTEVLGEVETTEKELINSGVTFKEETDKAKKKPAEGSPEEEASETPEEEAAEDDGGYDDVVGNQPRDEFHKTVKDMVEKCMKEYTGDLKGHIDGHMEKLHKKLDPMLEAAHTHEPAEELKKKEFEETQVTLKELITEQAQTIKALNNRLAELEGSTPRAFKGHVASDSDDNLTTKEKADAAGPAQDPLAPFMNFLGVPATGAPTK